MRGNFLIMLDDLSFDDEGDVKQKLFMKHILTSALV